MSDYFKHDTAIVDTGAVIGAGCKIWHFSHVSAKALIGENCVVGQNVFIADDVRIGNGVKIQNNVSVYAGVEIEDNVFLGPSMVFTNVINPRSAIEKKNEFRKTLVRKGATIGANATIICGNEIGAYAMIGAGAVVTKPVKPYELIIGNPGKHAGWVSKHGERLVFEERDVAVCAATGELYHYQNSLVTRMPHKPPST